MPNESQAQTADDSQVKHPARSRFAGLPLLRMDKKIVRVIFVMLLLCLVGVGGYVIGLHLWAGYQLRAAERLLERRDFRQASIHLEKCLAVRPDNFQARLLAARTARRLGNFDEAQRHLDIFKKKKGPKEMVSWEYKLLKAQQGNLEDTEGWLAFCAGQPENPEMPLVLEAFIEGSLKALEPAFEKGETAEGGSAALHLAQAQRAIGLWLQHRLSRADQIQGLVWRSRSHSFANDYPKSMEDVREALRLDPDHFQARLQLALSVAQETPSKAAAHLEILRQQEPENNRVRFALASIRRELGQLSEARQILDEMLAANPDHLSALIERGKVALGEDQPREAEAPLRKALALARAAQMPNVPEIMETLSGCLRRAGKEAEAKQYHDRFRELDAERKRQQDEAVQKGRSAGKGRE
jgi:tetratricopeptide (TPR) repeat protein